MTDYAHDGLCRDVSSWLPWYTNGTLPPEQCDRLHDHVRVCSDCRAALRTEIRLAEAMQSRAGPAVAVPVEHAWDRFQSKLQPPARERRWLLPLVAAQSAVILALAGLLLYRTPQPGAINEFRTMSSPAPNVVESNKERRTHVIRLDVQPAFGSDYANRLAARIGASQVDATAERQSLPSTPHSSSYRLLICDDVADAKMTATALDWLRRQPGVVGAELLP